VKYFDYRSQIGFSSPVRGQSCAIVSDNDICSANGDMNKVIDVLGSYR
jgi:hypothetical protein